MIQNPYKVLGVADGASVEECTKAYKRLAKKYHPDLNPGDKTAEKKMAEINAAYDAIKNGTADASPFSSGAGSSAGSTQASYYQSVINFINHGQYAQAINLLSEMDKSDARWYYLSALANMGYGNQEKALAHIKIAVSREPDNSTYQNAYESIRQGVNPMGFGFNPFSFFDFSSYETGNDYQSDTNDRRRTVYVHRSNTGCLGRILRFILILILIRLIFWGIATLTSWIPHRYDNYYATPNYGYSEGQSENNNKDYYADQPQNNFGTPNGEAEGA